MIVNLWMFWGHYLIGDLAICFHFYPWRFRFFLLTFSTGQNFQVLFPQFQNYSQFGGNCHFNATLTDVREISYLRKNLKPCGNAIHKLFRATEIIATKEANIWQNPLRSPNQETAMFHKCWKSYVKWYDINIWIPVLFFIRNGCSILIFLTVFQIMSNC